MPISDDEATREWERVHGASSTKQLPRAGAIFFVVALVATVLFCHLGLNQHWDDSFFYGVPMAFVLTFAFMVRAAQYMR